MTPTIPTRLLRLAAPLPAGLGLEATQRANLEWWVRQGFTVSLGARAWPACACWGVATDVRWASWTRTGRTISPPGTRGAGLRLLWPSPITSTSRTRPRLPAPVHRCA